MAVRANEGGEYISLEPHESAALKQLVVFMAAVAADPRAFRPAGKMAASIRRKARGRKVARHGA